MYACILDIGGGFFKGVCPADRLVRRRGAMTAPIVGNSSESTRVSAAMA
jgi:hypothetical protein